LTSAKEYSRESLSVVIGCSLLSAMSSRSLRSSQQGLLLIRTSTKQSGAFAVVRPSTWNGLPS